MFAVEGKLRLRLKQMNVKTVTECSLICWREPMISVGSSFCFQIDKANILRTMSGSWISNVINGNEQSANGDGFGKAWGAPLGRFVSQYPHDVTGVWNEAITCRTMGRRCFHRKGKDCNFFCYRMWKYILVEIRSFLYGEWRFDWDLWKTSRLRGMWISVVFRMGVFGF